MGHFLVERPSCQLIGDPACLLALARGVVMGFLSLCLAPVGVRMRPGARTICGHEGGTCALSYWQVQHSPTIRSVLVGLAHFYITMKGLCNLVEHMGDPLCLLMGLWQHDVEGHPPIERPNHELPSVLLSPARQSQGGGLPWGLVQC